MQRHPVDFLLPALPAPERHRIAEGAIVEVVTQGEISLMALFLRDRRQYGRQFGLHLVPRKVNACVVFQVPVHTRGDVHPGIPSHHDLLASLIQLKEILLTLHLFDLELGRSTFIDPFQQFIHRI